MLTSEALRGLFYSGGYLPPTGPGKIAAQGAPGAATRRARAESFPNIPLKCQFKLEFIVTPERLDQIRALSVDIEGYMERLYRIINAEKREKRPSQVALDNLVASLRFIEEADDNLQEVLIGKT